jgi:hypothetical protein
VYVVQFCKFCTKKCTCGAREPFSVKKDKNGQRSAYIESFKNFVGVFYHFLNIGGKSEKVVKL